MKLLGSKFDYLCKTFKIKNKVLAEYLACNRGNIINKRKEGLHEFSLSQSKKLEELFNVDYQLSFEELIEGISSDSYTVSKAQIDFVHESLKIHRQLKKYESFLVNQRIRKNLDNPEELSLPSTRYMHRDIIDYLMLDSMRGLIMYNELHKPSEYHKSSQAFLRHDLNARQGYILTVSFVKKNKYNMSEPYYIKDFDLRYVSINENERFDIDEVFKKEKTKSLSKIDEQSVMFKMDEASSKALNNLLVLKDDKCTISDFVKELYKFRKAVGKTIFMYSSNEVDEYNYMMEHINHQLRHTLKKTFIYHLNDMFKLSFGNTLNIEEALKLYNIKYDQSRLNNEIVYRSVAINTLINKLSLRYGGGTDELDNIYHVAPVHIYNAPKGKTEPSIKGKTMKSCKK